LVEKYGTVEKDLFVAFIDLEKAFDRVPTEVIWWALRKKGVMNTEVRAVKKRYQEAETAVQIQGKKTAWFEVKVGVHHGSALSPLLFAIVMDALTDHLNKDMGEFLFADDLAILGSSWEADSQKYAKCRKALESRGLKVNIKRAKAMKVRVKRAKGPISKINHVAFVAKE